jgi:hypothetical protein
MTYLDSIDVRLLDHVDEDADLSLATTERLLSYTSDLLAGAMTAAELAAVWPEWFDLVSAFIVIYGSLDLEDLEVESGFGRDTKSDDGGPPSGLVRGYLLILELELDLYLRSKQAS